MSNHLGMPPKPKPARMREQDYMMPMTDSKGRSDLVQFRATPSYLRLAEEVVGMRKFPFKTMSDLFRWCLKYGIDHLMAVEEPPTGLYMYVQAEMSRLRDEIYRMEQARDLDLLQQVVDHHLKIGTDANKLHALGLVMEAIEKASGIKERVWRKNQVDELKKRFGGVLRIKDEVGKMKVSLNALDFDESIEESEGETVDVDTE